MRVVPYLLHLRHDSLCKGFLKTKESDIENHIKICQEWQGMQARWTNPLQTIAALLLENHSELSCET